jgi:hypothetical protein
MDDWGNIRVKEINTGSDFWSIYSELEDDKSGFLWNRDIILDAFKSGDLYGLEVGETNSMRKRGARTDELFCKDSWYLLPCFCVKKDETVLIVWTHSRARRRGFAKKLIQSLRVTKVNTPLPESFGFWKAIGMM